jgi:signal peptidase I
LESQWKPKVWVSVVLGVFFQPCTFLYLNKLKIFWLYFLLIGIVTVLDQYLQSHWALIFIAICAMHAYVVAKNYDVNLARRWFSRWWGIPLIYVIIFAPILITRSFFYEPYSMPSSSMSPSLNEGDIILVKKFGYGSYGAYGLTTFNSGVSKNIELKRGGIYAFYPPHKHVPFVKRLIGKPGDVIEIKNHQITVNEIPLSEKIDLNNVGQGSYKEIIDGNSYYINILRAKSILGDMKLLVPQNQYFFLGDNRDNSADSRVWGTVSSNNFIGEVTYIYHK